MDPHSFIARAEAQRWLGIAEKLLMSHDLVGSKTFAIRARESDPRLEAADQILAIADTLLAAEKRVVGNNGAPQPDFYAILQLVRFVQDTDQIADQYRRLAVILNPHQNRFPYSDQAFQLVNDAWAVLSNPMRKSMYDSELDFPQQQQMNNLGFNIEQQHHHQQHQHQQQQQQHNFFSINQEMAEPPQTFQARLQQSHQQQQLQQHNFLSQPNPVRPQEHLFQPQVQPFQVTNAAQQQQQTQPQPTIHSPPPPAASQPPFSWPQAPQLQQIKQEQQQQVKQEQHQLQLQQERQKQLQIQQEQQKQLQIQQEQQKQLQLQQEQQKQLQLQQEQEKQLQLQQEQQRKQLQLQQEQQKQLQLQQEQQRQLKLQQEQLKQQELQQEQLKQQQEEQRLQREQRQEEQRLQQEQQRQHHNEQQKQQQQPQEPRNQNADPVQLPSQVNSDNGVREEEPEPETDTTDENVDDSPTFWTACPYCFYMYEYPRAYVECTLRCDNCKRAFQAVRISSPPPIIEGQDAYFYCWGFFPVGVSMSHLQKNNSKGTNSNWTPFSPMYNASNNVQNHLNECAAPKENLFAKKSSGPRIYFDDIIDDVFEGISEPSDSSDIEWDSPKKNKLKRMKKGFQGRKQVLALGARKSGSVKNLKSGIPVQESAGVPIVPFVEANLKAVGSNPRKQSGQVAKELGKLDLNVEFNNNEGEEPAPRMITGTRGHGHGQGEEDNIEEGIGFFEGLDEFLSSLPILSVVNEEKVKVA